MVTNNNTSDTELVSSLIAGDERAFSQIYHQHAAALMRYADGRLASQQDSEDMVQAVFADLWMRRHALVPETRIGALLFHNLKCRLIEHYRHSLVHERYAAHIRFSVDLADNSTETETRYNETKALLDSGIASLPPAMQKAFRLSREHDLSAMQIAEQMQISPRTVETHLLTARQRLRALLNSAMLLLGWLLS